jgi:hypothetical protein
MSDRPVPPYVGFCVLELLGHRRLGGYLMHETVCGVEMLQINVHAMGSRPSFTQFYHPQAVYCITPCDEDTAWFVASEEAYSPLTRYELRRALDLLAASETAATHEDDDDDDIPI